MTQNRAEIVSCAVPDVLAPGLRIVFCGINPGRASAAAGAHFANPRNDFWRLLHASGLTPRLLEPRDQHELPALGLGLTNAARRTTRGSSELRRADFAGAEERLAELAAELVPAWIAFVGKEAYRGAFGERPELGLQQRRLRPAHLFVLPSTSPANAAVPWRDRLRWFAELAHLSTPVARPGCRALLIDGAGRVFLHRFVGPRDPGVWVTPGGAAEAGETPEQTLRRELREELRLGEFELGPWIWRRRHLWYWPRFGQTTDTRELFALVRVPDRGVVQPTEHDSLLAGPDTVEEHRWWSVDEILASSDEFAPRRLGRLLGDLLRGDLPTSPVDVGV